MLSRYALTGGPISSGGPIIPPAYPPLPWQSPTTLTQTIPAYPYQEYSDDDNIQAFFAAFNTLAQEYVNWFATISLPVYTAPQISDALLDWVAEGLYGITRPTLPSGNTRNIGAPNTYAPNVLAPNQYEIIEPTQFYATNDDVFKRIITWHFYKGDGKVFDIRWLKRRIMRFLTGTNGTAPDIDETYQVSVTFGTDNQVDIDLSSGFATVTGGSIPNKCAPNTIYPNQINSTFTPGSTFPLAPIFQAAVNAGVLELPPNYVWVVTI